MKFIDLTGCKFGKLTVLKRVDRPDNIKQGTYWLCKCECGGKTTVNGGDLKKGGVQSCGCMKFSNIEGKKFGRLTALHIDENNRVSSSGSLQWVCQCDCGNIKTISSQNLIKRATKSCGCLHDEVALNNLKQVEKYLELQNKRYGKLTVLEKSTQVEGDWLCRCDCGNEIEVNYYNLVYNQTKSCGCLISSGEEEVLKILLKYKINFKKQYTFPEWFNTVYWRYRFDFAVLDKNNNLKFIIEYDGFPHFGFTNKTWNTDDIYFKTIQRDNYKSNYCSENSVPLLRIPYWDFESIETILLKWASKFGLI